MILGTAIYLGFEIILGSTENYGKKEGEHINIYQYLDPLGRYLLNSLYVYEDLEMRANEKD